MTQGKTKAAVLAGPDPIQILIQLNKQTGTVVVTGPTGAPGLMLEMLARAISQVGRTVTLKTKANGDAKDSGLILPRHEIVIQK